MKKILVPTDFSSFADSALKMALDLANKSGAEIVLLNVMLTPDNTKIQASEKGINIINNSESKYLMENVEAVQKNLNELIKESGYKKMSYQIISGNITQSVIDYAKTEKIDLIIMGTQGEGGYDAIFVGSNAEKIVRLSDCPVITIRKYKETETFDNIVFASNFSDKYNYPVESLKVFQQLFNARLSLVYVNTPGNFTPTEELNKKADKFIQKYNIENCSFHIYCDFVEDDGIINFAKSSNADMVAVASQKRRGFARLLSGSVSEGVVNVSSIPVLTLSLEK